MVSRSRSLGPDNSRVATPIQRGDTIVREREQRMKGVTWMMDAL